MLPSNFYRSIRHVLAPVCALGVLLVPHLSEAQNVPAVCVGMNPEHTNSVTTGTLAPPLKARWSVTMPGRVSAPLIAGGRVYVLARLTPNPGMKLVAINSASGATEWETTVSTSEGWGAMAYSPATSSAPSIVVQCGDGQLRSFDGYNGSARWSVSTSYIADAPPVVRNGRVYVGAGNALKCYLVSNGQLVWSKSVRGSSRSAPAVSANNEVYVSYSCPQVYKFNGNDGTQNWNYGGDSCSGGGGSTPSLFGGKLYVRESQYNFDTGLRTGFVFDGATGADVGTMRSDGLAAYFGNRSFNVLRGNSTGNGSIRAVALDTNTEVWNWTDGGTLNSPVVLNGRVYVGSSLGKIYALDPQTGSLLWSTTIGDAVVTDTDYNNISPFTAMAAGEDLLLVPAQNKLVAFEAYSATDTIAPTGYVNPASLPYIQYTDFIRNFPNSVNGTAYDNDGGIGVDRVEIAISRPIGGSSYGGREYFTNTSTWITTPRYYPTTLSGTVWTLNSTYFDSNISSGSYWIEVRTYDRAGNMGYKVHPVWVDKTAPTTTLAFPKRYTNSFTVLQGTAVDNTNGVGVATVKVSLFREDVYNPYGDTGAYWNGTDWIASNSVTSPPLLDCSFAGGQWRCTAPLPSIDSMPEKNYLVRPVATDKAGNATDLNYVWNTFTFRVDKTAPTLVFGTPSPAPNAAGWNNTSVSIPYTASDAVGIASSAPGSPVVIESEGTGNRTVTVIDLAGNSAQFVSPTVKIDKKAPVSQISTSPAVSHYDPELLYATITATDEATPGTIGASSGVAQILYSLDGGPIQTYTTRVSITGYGSHTISFYSRDAAGNIEVTQEKTVVIAVPNGKPTANAATLPAANEDTAQTFTLTGSDPENDPLTYAIVSPPAHGTLSGTAPNLTYTPHPNYNGTDSFIFRVNDGTSNSPVATVSLTVTAVDDAPIAIAQSVAAEEDTAKAIVLFGRDFENDPLTFSVVTQPSHGVLSGTAPNLTYTPDADFNGADSFTFKVTANGLESAAATVSINVASSSDAPIAVADSFDATEDQTLTIAAPGVLFNDSDPDGDTITAILNQNAENGDVTLATNGGFTYVPDTDFSGTDTFKYHVRDGAIDSNIVTVTINVAPANDAPTALLQSVSTDEDTAKTIVLGGVDVENDALTFSVVTQPTHGVLSGTAPNLTYTPNADYNGSDSFTFKANDGTVDSAAATITLTVKPVNDGPAADAQSVTTAEDTAKTIALSGTDIDGDTLTYTVASQPTHGVLSGTAPNLTYTPAADYNGSDSFTFKVSDGTLTSSVATISISVTAVNDAPTALALGVSASEDTVKSFVLDGSDVEGDTLAYSVVSQPSNGVLSGTAPNLTYTPNTDYNGSDSFTFKVNDGALDSSVATVSITVTPVNDAPVANGQTVSTSEDIAKTITLSGSDLDGDALTYSVTSQPSHGTVSGSAPNLTYTPAADYNGSDSFTFKVSDGTLSSVSATVSVTVTPVNDAPTALTLGVATAEDTAKSFVLGGSDIEGDALTYSVTSQPSNGVLSGTAPNLTYTPAANYFGSDSFTFRVNDGALDSAVATVSLTITPVNDAPTANAQSVTTAEDTAKSIVLTGADIDGDSLTYTVTTQPTKGTLSGTAPNLTYTPSLDYFGSDSFAFKVSDGTLSSAVTTVSITVTAVNDAPKPTALSLTTLEDTAKSFVLSGTDVDSGSLTYSIVTPPTKGVISGTAPNLTYTPNLNANGSDSFVWKVSDGSLSTNSTASVTITPVNDAPTANAQSVTTAQNTAANIVLTGADVDGDALTYTIVSNPTKGTLSGTGANRTYTPNAGVSGSDSFTFKTSDASLSSATATVTITITAAPAAGCVITYNITNQWPGGFTADVIIKNNGPAINGWTLAWTFPGDQKATNLWNGVVTQTGKNVSVKDASWNKAIPTGGTATIGFQATFSGTNAKPTAFTLNGVPCTIQ